MPPSLPNVVLAGAGLLVATIAFGKIVGSPDRSPVFGVRLPSDYRNWQVVSVAHEAGSLNDIRVILGNKTASGAFRMGRRPFPDGSVIVRMAWKYVSSERNNAIFGQAQSFVAGDPLNVQVAVRDSHRYQASGGWGFGQFEKGVPNAGEALVRTCVTCHTKLPSDQDMVFTRYAQSP